VHVTTGQPLGARVDFTPATAEDTGSAVTVSYHPAGPGSRFPSGRTEVRAEAVDASGNTASCTFTVSVSLPDAPSDRPVVPEVPAPAGATRSTFGCAASPASAALPWAALLLLAALRRRSRAYRG
jgi:uncharacterized protein (TIGR03382 family)